MPAPPISCFTRHNGPPTSGGVPVPPLLPTFPPLTSSLSVPIHHQLAGPTEVANYIRTSHVLPAARPRSLLPHSPLRENAVSVQGEVSDVKALAEALVQAKVGFEQPSAQQRYKGRSHALLWNCVDRYVRSHPPLDPQRPGMTLFLTHATGFPRQIWEPTLIRIFAATQRIAPGLIDEIWSFESVQHGDCGVLNDKVLGDVFDWQDQCRDILNFLLHYLPAQKSDAPLPKLLSRIGSRSQIRKVVAIGHSYGGTTLVRVAIDRPDMFERLIVVEPMITPPTFTRGKGLDLLLWSALGKQSHWESWEQAEVELAKSRLTKAWHPDVLQTFVEHGLTDCSDANNPSAVRLKTRPFDEAVVYCEWNVCYEAWTGLKDLPSDLNLHWIMSAKTNATTGGTAMTQETVWRKGDNVSNVCLPSAGHLIVQEAPDELAEQLVKDLLGKTALYPPKSQL